MTSYSVYVYVCISISQSYCYFYFNNPATTKIYTLSLHDALPILDADSVLQRDSLMLIVEPLLEDPTVVACGDRKSTRLNSSHMSISYAVFCLKKKKIIRN